jgi:predicted MFS family arabinose efflux permease
VGNALFIATSLAVIVASASGGFAGAIVLYETALGVGIATGPLLGGALGEVSWRGPFYGVAALMAIALIATVVLVEKTPKPPQKTGLSAPLRALRHRGLLTLSLTALCYNWGFFTVLGYAPFPMDLSPIKLGLVFTGWGTLVAIFAVFGAPRLQERLGLARAMYVNLAAFAAVVLVIAVWTTDRAVLIPAVIVSGIFIGVNNTITTQAVMTVSPVERPVASASARGRVRQRRRGGGHRARRADPRRAARPHGRQRQPGTVAARPQQRRDRQPAGPAATGPGTPARARTRRVAFAPAQPRNARDSH